MIYEHNDYRTWLRLELQKRATDNRLFSGNAFAKKIGVSQSYFSLVLGSKRPLTEKAAFIISDKLSLSKNESDYLQLLIKKEKTKDAVVQKYIHLEINKFKKANQFDDLNLEKFKVISDWHYSALLELLTIKNISHAPKYLAKRLSMETSDIAESLDRLVKLELIKKVKAKYVRNDKGNLGTPTEFASIGLKNFHKQILQKASKAVDEQAVTNRVFSGITMAIDPDKLPEAKKMIENFKQELSALLETESKSKVYQLSLQLFQLDHEIEDSDENN